MRAMPQNYWNIAPEGELRVCADFEIFLQLPHLGKRVESFACLRSTLESNPAWLQRRSYPYRIK